MAASSAESLLALHQADIALVFHPLQAARDLAPVLDAILPASQTIAAVLVIAGLVRALQREDPPMENIAHRLLLAGLIATVPVWRALLEETADALAATIGTPAVAQATLARSEGGTDPGMQREATPLQVELRRLAEHWGLEKSPLLEILEEQRAPVAGEEEAWLAAGWNWAKGTYRPAVGEPATGWESASGSARALALHGLCLVSAFSALGCLVALHAAETVRHLLFQGGCALLPLALAALGSRHWRASGIRFLGALAAVAAWPAAWALAHTATLGIARQTNDFLSKTAASALYPKLDSGPTSLALAAPWLSWSLLALACVLTLSVGAWCLLSVWLAPRLLHRLSNGGAAWIAVRCDAEPQPTSTSSGCAHAPAAACAGPPSTGSYAGLRSTASAVPTQPSHILTSSLRTPSTGGSVCGTSERSVLDASIATTAGFVRMGPLSPTLSEALGTSENNRAITASASVSNGTIDSSTTDRAT